MTKLIILSFYLILSAGLNFSGSVSAQNQTNKKQTIKQDEMTITKHYTNAVDSYIRGLNEKDLEGILALYADNATIEDPVGSEIVSGIAAIRQFYSGAVNIDLTLTRTGPVRVAGVEAAFPFQLRMNVEGAPMITDIIDVFRFDDEGKILSMRAFWGETNRRVAKE